jgi:hypothetical protein
MEQSVGDLVKQNEDHGAVPRLVGRDAVDRGFPRAMLQLRDILVAEGDGAFIALVPGVRDAVAAGKLHPHRLLQSDRGQRVGELFQELLRLQVFVENVVLKVLRRFVAAAKHRPDGRCDCRGCRQPGAGHGDTGRQHRGDQDGDSEPEPHDRSVLHAPSQARHAMTHCGPPHATPRLTAIARSHKCPSGSDRRCTVWAAPE